jgi:hypothetical protein
MLRLGGRILPELFVACHFKDAIIVGELKPIAVLLPELENSCDLGVLVI